MTSTPQGRTTQLLNRFAGGDQSVQEEVMELVHAELQKLARSNMRHWNVNNTLQPTALVHEAWIRLVDQASLEFDGRAQFYSLASRIMRTVLIDHHRARKAAKRGGGAAQVSLTSIESESVETPPTTDVLALEVALVRLEELDRELCRLVELRFFGGLTNAEIAEVTQTSLRTVERRWRQARAWLQAELET